MYKILINSYFIYLLPILFISSCVHSKNDTIQGTSKTSEIDSLIKTYADYEQFNGAILVAHKGQIVYKNAFGMANMDWNIPNQTNTRFRLGSVTKQFTSMLIMQLVAEKKLELHTPIATYLPSYPKPQADQITIHHLLTHSSGIPNYTSFPNYRTAMRNPTPPLELVKTFADSTLLFTPGDRFHYSNSGYVLLGQIIEKVTGKPYEKVLEEKIFDPLDMDGSGYEKGQQIIKNKALGYYRNGSRFANANYIDMSMSYAAGGIHSTVENLYLWDRALYTEKLLPKTYLDSLFLPYQPIGEHHYAYGWSVGKMPIGNTEEKIGVIDLDGIING
ncbi:MAG: serine hydrolase domain-containing protein, partial [Flavobacteriaceae bacterium]